MMRLFHRIAAILSVGLLSACTGHVLPASDQFIVPQQADPASARDAAVFVDANGSFYPSGWCSQVLSPKKCAATPFKPPRQLPGASLLNFADRRWVKGGGAAFRARIDADETRQLDAIAAFAANKQRIYILVHGFNSTVAETDPSFQAIEDRLAIGPTDGVIRFYWDGLTGSGLGALRIWFNAAGYSQVAGSRGLRRVLDRLPGKSVYLIAHSRGASVILSALGNPVYDRQFKADTNAVAAGWKLPITRLLEPDPLKEQGSNFHVLLMAAAVGRIDFCDAREQERFDVATIVPRRRLLAKAPVTKDDDERPWVGCVELRRFSNQLKSIRYVVNIADPVLKKGVGFQYRFNPTTLGLEPEVGRAIAQEGGYPMTAYFTDPPRSRHDFLDYVRDPSFFRMLCDAGILRPDLKGRAGRCEQRTGP